MSQYRHHRRPAFTLIELLIVVFIITMLLQLALPAVEMARERANVASCQNNLRQQAMAFQLYEGANGNLPSGGWGYRWAPDPDRGVGIEQPGGWAYSLLPFYEQQALFGLGAGGSKEEKSAANKRRLESPIAIHFCPSRRLPRAYPIYPKVSYVLQPIGSDRLEIGARIDYAANAGGRGFVSWLGGPDSVEEAEDYDFFDPVNGHGVIYPRSNLRMAQISDGASNTYLLGEKYLDVSRYKNGTSFGDDQGPYVSDDRDSVRFAGGELAAPAQDREEDRTEGFGSAHPSGFSMAFCDGSVRLTAYEIDSLTHCRQANRTDDE
jgi:prepilin-type N-terminal cleavage/methylation domain-containing protein/prepilin-type processing-associated H-X9-DG protein